MVETVVGYDVEESKKIAIVVETSDSAYEGTNGGTFV
jgi:hypothetical protein